MPGPFKSLAYFVNRSRVLGQYRLFLRTVGRLGEQAAPPDRALRTAVKHSPAADQPLHPIAHVRPPLACLPACLSHLALFVLRRATTAANEDSPNDRAQFRGQVREQYRASMHEEDENAVRERVIEGQLQLDALGVMIDTAIAPPPPSRPSSSQPAGGGVVISSSSDATWTDDGGDPDDEDVKGRVGVQWAWERPNSVPSPVVPPPKAL